MSFDPAEIQARFTLHRPSNEDVVRRHEWIREECAKLSAILCSACPESRELSLALTNLDQVCMYANAAVARHQ